MRMNGKIGLAALLAFGLAGCSDNRLPPRQQDYNHGTISVEIPKLGKCGLQDVDNDGMVDAINQDDDVIYIVRGYEHKVNGKVNIGTNTSYMSDNIRDEVSRSLRALQRTGFEIANSRYQVVKKDSK